MLKSIENICKTHYIPDLILKLKTSIKVTTGSFLEFLDSLY